MSVLTALVWLLLVGAPSAQLPAASTVPQLDIQAPQDLAASRSRLESFDRTRLRGVMQLVGLDDPGPAIRVVLASEASEWARQVPPSTAGFATIGDAGLVVLFPSRSPRYPDDSLEDVLHHEIAHVLMARASRGKPLPLWFHEGLAMSAERTWDLEDQARLLGALAFVSRTDLESIDALFSQDEGSKSRAYALAGAFVRDLINRHGSSAPGWILKRVAAGDAFDDAFARVMGQSVAEAEAAFWDRNRFWTRFGPFLTTSTAMWMAVTLIALYAFVARRRRSAALRKRWEEEGE